MMTAAAQEPPWVMKAAAGLTAAGVDREEAAWVARARTGEEAAVRWLLARYRGRAVRLAAHVLRRRPEEAEDVAQEAFVRAFRRLPRLRGDAGFGPWLFRIVVRLCLDRRRAAHWNREVSPDDLGAWEARVAPATEGLDTRLLVGMLLDRLTPPMRAALVLRELEGLDYAEVAEALDIPVGTVRSRLHAARAQFRELWTAALMEDADA